MCIFENVPAPAIMLDTSLALRGANYRALSFHGCNTYHEIVDGIVIGGGWKSIIAKARIALKGTSSIVEYSFISNASKNKKWSKAVVAPVRDVEGNIIGVSIIEKDVTLKRNFLPEIEKLKKYSLT